MIQLIQKVQKYCNLKIIFTSAVRVKSFFAFKDNFPKMLLSRLVYKYKCGGCNTTYCGKTKGYFKVRNCEHLRISFLTRKKVKIDKNKLMVIQEHRIWSEYRKIRTIKNFVFGHFSRSVILALKLYPY